MEKLIADIKVLRERLAAIDQRQAEIEADVEAKHSGKFTPELRTEYDALGEEYAAKDAECATSEADLKRLQSRQDRTVPNAPLPRRTSAGSAAPLDLGEQDSRRATRITVPATVRRTGSLANFHGVSASGATAEERAYGFGMLMLAKASMDMPAKFKFQQAIDFAREKFGLSSETGPDFASVLVREEFGTDLIDLREKYGVVRQLFKRRPMSSDTRTDPRRAGGLTAYFVGEGSAGTESTKEWNQVRLTAKKLMVISRYTSELNMDSVLSIGDDLAGEIAYAFAEKEDDCGINGTGISTYGKITGVIPALQTAAGSPTTTSAGGVIVGAGNLFSELTLANFHSVVGILPQYADTPNTCWVVHKLVWSTVMQRLAFAQGGVTTNEVQGGGRYEFLGYPVKVSQKMPSTDGNSQICALLGDFTLGASFGDRALDNIQFSDQAYVNSQSLWERDEIGIRGTERFDINVHDVGNTTTAGPIVGLQSLNS
jgi:HK97 family phage major capsid protein